MSGSGLIVSLSEAEVSGGSVLRGLVTLTAAQGRDLRVALVWTAAGRGAVDQGDLEPVLLASGAAEPGTFPFSITLPHAPLSHRGHLLTIGWSALASVDLPDGTRTASATFTLHPGANPPEDPRTVPPLPPLIAHHTQSLTGADLVARLLPAALGGLVALIGGVALLAGAVAAISSRSSGAVAVLLGGLLVFFGLRAAQRAAGNLVARRKLRDITISVAPSTARPGTEIQVEAGFCSVQPIDLLDVRLRLILRETAWTGEGLQRQAHSIDRVFASTQIGAPQQLDTSGTFSGAATLALPPDAPASFQADRTRLLWLVQLDINIDDWPDLHESHPILVS